MSGLRLNPWMGRNQSSAGASGGCSRIVKCRLKSAARDGHPLDSRDQGRSQRPKGEVRPGLAARLTFATWMIARARLSATALDIGRAAELAHLPLDPVRTAQHVGARAVGVQ